MDFPLPKPDHSLGGIPIYVSKYAEKGTIRFIPNFDQGKPIIITDSFMTIEQKLKAWFEAQDEDFFKRCGIIYNIKEGS